MILLMPRHCYAFRVIIAAMMLQEGSHASFS